MSMGFGIIVYLVLWWLVFTIMVLLKHRAEAEGRQPPGLGPRIAFTSLIAAALWAVIEAFLFLNLISIGKA